MSVLKTRSRLVSFRLTQEELEHLRVACLLHEARNISDFARGAVLQLAAARVRPEAQMLDRFTLVESRLVEMETMLRQTTEMMRALLQGVVNSPHRKGRGA